MSTARNIKIRIGARLPVLPKKVEHFNSLLPQAGAQTVSRSDRRKDCFFSCAPLRSALAFGREEKKLCEFVRHDCNSCPDANPRLRSVAHVLVALFTLIALGARAYGQTPAPEIRVRVHPHPQIHVNDFEDSEMTVSEQETINKSFPFPATGGRRSVDVDNVWGFVHVTGGSSDQVQLVAKKTIRAESKDKLELAKKDVTLDIGQQGNALTFYVNGPFRCHCDCCSNCREHQGYIVKYEFELQVPRDIDLTARTVNDGDVIVQNVAGQYSVHNVNGPVEMRDVAGSGDAKTVNGELKVLFRGNPQSNSSFASLNGDVDLYFLPKLSADLRFKTFNGAVFSDFEMAALPQRQPVEEHQNGKFIFRADRYAGGRVAGGGPEIKVETLNGDIHIRERHD